MVIEAPGSGFIETLWADRNLRIGSALLRVTINVPRCVVTILGQADLPYDPEILRVNTRLNAIDALSSGTKYPCAGVYAEVLSGGEIRLGDPVTIE
jgi:MOSC domain-containing protein YiiM